MTIDNPHCTKISPFTLEQIPLLCLEPCLDQLRLLRLPEVLRIIPVARSTWWGWVAAGIAPAPVRLGRTTAWRYSDLVALIEQNASQGRK